MSKKSFLTLAAIFIYTCLLAQNMPVSGAGGSIDPSIPGTITNVVTPPAAYTFTTTPLYNSVKTLVPNFLTTNEGSITESTTAVQVKLNTTYFNGGGAPLEKIERYGTTSTDIIQAYDNRPGSSQYLYLKYPISTVGSTGNAFRLSPFSEQASFYNAQYPAEPGTALSQTSYESDAAGRYQKAYGPGKSSVGQKHGVTITVKSNGTSEVMIWDMNTATNQPTFSGHYAPDKLIKKITTSDDGAQSIEYTDFDGKIIATDVLSDASASEHLITYYVYDLFERIVCTISPKGYDKLSSSGWSMATPFIFDNLCDYSIYDQFGRVVEKHQAGKQGNDQFVYDRHNRLILSQSPADAASSIWWWRQYDKVGRIIQTGTRTGGLTRASLQGWFDNGNLPATYATSTDILYFLYAEALQGFYPMVPLTGCEIYTCNYYDEYGSFSYSDGTSSHAISLPAYDPSFLIGHLQGGLGTGAITPAMSDKTRGRLTYNVSKVIKPASSTLQNYVTTVYYYDEYGRVIQSARHNAQNTIDVIGNQYSIDGRLLVKLTRVSDPFVSGPPVYTTIDEKYIYNTLSNSLKKVTQTINGLSEREIATYQYDDLGRVKVKTLGAIETQNLAYNQKGQLTGINPYYAELGIDGGQAMTFGESIKYDAGFTRKLYCGNPTGIVWKNKGSNSCSYGYTYDNAGRLKQADFNTYSSIFIGSPSSWNHSSMDYTEGNITYDLNGNIKHLERFGPVTGGLGKIDDLTYLYENGDVSNRIKSVGDAVGTITAPGYEFRDQTVASLEYEYDNNGNIKKDLNKLTQTQFYYFDKPKRIDFTNTDYIEYAYDAFGNRLQDIHYDHISGATKKVDYIGDVTYKNGVPDKIYHSEGFAIKNGSDYDYYYFVRDHLGNVRNVLNSTWTYVSTNPSYMPPPPVTYTATHEDNLAQVEEQLFDLIPNVRDDKPLGTQMDKKAAVLDASDKYKTIGTSLLLKVMADDELEISAESYFEEAETLGETLPAEQFVGNILETMVAGGVGQEGETPHLADLGKLFSADNLAAFEAIQNQQVDPNIPQTFINYLVFDENFSLVVEESGRIQIGSLPGIWNTVTLPGKIHLHTSGYVLIFPGTKTIDHPTWVDNSVVKVYKGGLMDVNLYYPFGLPVNMSIASAAHPENNCLYQTTEQDNTNSLFEQDFGARQYDPQLGRFKNIDAANQFYSGYVGMGNNPARCIDPDGNWALVDDLGSMLVGGVFNLVSQSYAGAVTSPGQALSYFLVGAAAGEATIHLGPAAGGAILGLGNDAVRQISTNGIENLDMSSLFVNSGLGALTSLGGSAVGKTINPLVGTWVQNNIVNSPILMHAIGGAVGGGLTGAMFGGGSSLLSGGSLNDALNAAGSDALFGASTGFLTGTIEGMLVAKNMRRNAVTGKVLASERINKLPLADAKLMSTEGGGQAQAGAELAQSLGAARSQVKQWLQNVGNLDRSQLIADIEGAGFKKVFDDKNMMHFEKGGMKIRLDPPQGKTQYNHMHLNLGGNRNAYDIYLNPVYFRSDAAHIPIK